MLRFFTPLLLLQAFCIYHAYRNHADQRWYWFILLFPGIGSAFYLFHHFYNRSNLNSISETVKEVVYSNYRIEQLEKAYRFSDNLKNRINLADAYVEYQRYNDAIKLYQESLDGIMADDVDIKMKLLNACFLNADYAQTIILGNQLEGEKSFRNSDYRVYYAWAQHLNGQTENAEKIFNDLNKPLTNFKQRAEYSKYLIGTSKTKEAKDLLTTLNEEFEFMRGPEKKHHRETIREVKELYSRLNNTR